MGLFGLFKKKKEENPVKHGVYVIDEKECIACGDCETECHMDAVVLAEEAYRIEAHLCSACGACADACPMNCIVLED